MFFRLDMNDDLVFKSAALLSKNKGHDKDDFPRISKSLKF